MNRRGLLRAAAAGLAAGAAGAGRALAACLSPPATARRPLRIVQLGRVRVDDYAWLKPANWKAVWRDPKVLSPMIRGHLAEETAYAAAVLTPTAALQTQLFTEMKARTAPQTEASPEPDGPYDYAQRFEAGAQHPVFVRRRRPAGAEEVLLDLQARADAGRRAGRTYLAAPATAHSPDHTLFAWAEDAVGSENFTLYVRDLTTGELLPGPVQQAYGDFVFSADSQWLYWTWRSPESRPARVYRRPARGGPDVLVYEEADPGFLVQVSRTASRAYVLIRAWNADTSEVRLIPSARPTEAPRVVEPRRQAVLYSLEHWDDRFVVLTNADGAVDFKLMWADAADPSRRTWRDWVPHRPGRFITEMRAYREHFVRVEREDARLSVVTTARAGLRERPIAFPEAAYAVTLRAGAGYDTSTLRMLYQSPRTPPRWIEHDMANGRTTVIKADAAPGVDPDRYVVERLFARSPDGAQVPITVLRRRDQRLDGSAPLLLYGYGAYGFAVEAEFSVAHLSLVDAGWVSAVAHVRGGSEKGWSWYLAARQQTKARSFADFIACAEHLAGHGYSRQGRIVAHGLSAGGLLVGASLNLRPDLFGAVIAQAPFVDVLNTMSDAAHPLVPLARPDWGDPLASAQAYDVIAGYSPYDNVGRRAYPPVLATSAVADDRVGFWEPAKWIARLRASSTSGAPMLLQVDGSGGHHGQPGRFEALAQQAQLFAFAIRCLEPGGLCGHGTGAPEGTA